MKFPSDFTIDPNTTVLGFTGMLSGNSCTGSLNIFNDASGTRLNCKLTTPISLFVAGTKMTFSLSGITNP